jgi:general secretion pathway protein K
MNTVRNQRGGVALVLVIWILVVLVAIVGEFSYSMRTEVNITRNFKEEEESYQLAYAGVEQAKIELLSRPNNAIVYKNEDDLLIIGDEEDMPARSDTIGNGSFEYKLIDEDSKLNINTASQDQLREVFIASGVDTAEVDEIVDSILDWRDPNDLHLLNGAEEDYYRSLDVPYSAKDAAFDTIEELLLVRGMSREILYGVKGTAPETEKDQPAYSGVITYLTVYDTGRINVNTASLAVLEAAFGIEEANNIMILREDGPLQAHGRGKALSEIFTVHSTGTSADGKIKRTIKATLQRRSNRVELLYWNDNAVG